MIRHVWFAHGKESGPWGRKISALADLARERGLTVESPDYSFTMDPDERVRHLQSLKPPADEGLALVGSSMGGYVAAVASGTLNPAGLFLMAPAVDIPGYAADTTPHADVVSVVHGWQDEIIPHEVVYRWCARHRVPLQMLDAEHSLSSRLDQVVTAFEAFLDRLQA